MDWSPPMICVCCQNPDREVQTGQVCPRCAHRIACDLRDIADLYVRISLWPDTGATGPRVSGSREAPLPLRVDALDLTMPARGGTVHDPHGDQAGHVAVASVLDQWVEDWRQHRAAGERRPGPPTVVVLVDWLGIRLTDACHDHPAVDEFAADMRRLRRVLRVVVGDGPARPERLSAPCPGCDLLALTRDHDWVRCQGCGEWWTEEQYTEWVGRLARSARMAA
jgi:hypothetical protein